MDNDERKQRVEDEERKQALSRVPYTQLEQIHSDFVMAMALQEQERAFTILSDIESDSNEEESDEASSSESNADDIDYEFFQSYEFESEMESLQEEQNSNSDEDMEDDGDEDEDEVDPDELSYEDLIALGEFVGQEKRGLSINEISTCLRPCKYESLARKTGTDRCVICQMEYEEDESLVALSCDHPYHSECIAKWLQISKICPICSTEVSSPKNISTND